MIQFIFLVPLVVGGVGAASWREHKIKQRHKARLITNQNRSYNALEYATPSPSKPTIDDVIEFKHYQQTSLAGLVVTGAGSLLFPPLLLAAIPLFSYNIYYLWKTLRRTQAQRSLSPLNLFEVISLTISFLGQNYVLASLLLLFSFTTRKAIVKFLNFSKIGLKEALNNPKFHQVWVLREEVEVQMLLTELQKKDIIAIYEGDIIPIDGVVVEGEADVEQYSITGKLQSVNKANGDAVSAFTRVEAGRILVRYT